MDWRIYYGDGSTFSANQGVPNDAPPFNVQAIVQVDRAKHSVGRTILHGWSFYYWREDHKEWWGDSREGVLDMMYAREPICALLQGRNIHKDQFDNVMFVARHDPAFPVKSANRKLESP